MLLKGRRCLLVNGKAIVHCHRLVSIVTLHFRAELSRSLATSAKAMASFSDERILPLLSVWSNGYLTANGAISATGSIDLRVIGMFFCFSAPLLPLTASSQDIDKIMQRDAPKCMSTPFRTLRQHHHLMHGGRMQLGLFLKSIGLSMEDSIQVLLDFFCDRRLINR